MSKPTRVRGPDGNRWYEVGGNRYPSVTTVTGSYGPKKEAIEGFVEAVGEDRAEEIKDYTALRGTLVHHRILNPLAMRPLPTPDVDLERWDTEQLATEIETCVAMWEQLDYPVGDDPFIEERLYSHEHGYAGTMDMMTDEGVVTDLKTSKPKPKGWAPSDSQKMQVAAYVRAAEEREKVPEPTGGAIVVLHPDPKNNPRLEARVEELSMDDVDFYFGEFKRLLEDFHE